MHEKHQPKNTITPMQRRRTVKV